MKSVGGEAGKLKKKKGLGTELKYLFHNVDGKRN